DGAAYAAALAGAVVWGELGAAAAACVALGVAAAVAAEALGVVAAASGLALHQSKNAASGRPPIPSPLVIFSKISGTSRSTALSMISRSASGSIDGGASSTG